MGENSNVKTSRKRDRQNLKGKIVQTFVDCIKKDWFTSLIIGASFVLYMMVIAPSGSTYCFNSQCGMYFWGAHTHDGIWHLALIESAFDTIPFRFPGYFGETLSGYNFLLDGVLYVFSLFGISSSFLYFKAQALLWFVSFIWLLYLFSKYILKNSMSFRYVSFFVLLTSSFGFIIQWVNHKSLAGSAGTPTMQGPLGMTNPQFMWSLCVILALWVLLETKNKKWWLLPILIFIGLGLKFYALVPLSILMLFYMAKSILLKEYLRGLIIIAGYVAGVVFAYYLFYFSRSGGGGLVWQPFAIPHQMIEDPNMWHMPELVRQRYFLLEAGNMFSPRLWWVEVKTLLYFINFNYGIRFVAFLLAPFLFLCVPRFRKHWQEAIIGYAIITLTTATTVMFIQNGVWWNTIQFMYYGLFLGSLLTAIVFESIVTRLHPLLRVLLTLVTLVLFTPSIIDIVQTFGTVKSALYIKSVEMQALKQLAVLPDGVVLTSPFARREGNILPFTYDTAYVSAYSGKQLYMGDETQLQLLGIDYGARKKQLAENPCKVLQNTQIRYAYIDNSDASAALRTCVEQTTSFYRYYDKNGYQIWVRK